MFVDSTQLIESKEVPGQSGLQARPLFFDNLQAVFAKLCHNCDTDFRVVFAQALIHVYSKFRPFGGIEFYVWLGGKTAWCRTRQSFDEIGGLSDFPFESRTSAQKQYSNHDPRSKFLGQTRTSADIQALQPAQKHINLGRSSFCIYGAHYESVLRVQGYIGQRKYRAKSSHL